MRLRKAGWVDLATCEEDENGDLECEKDGKGDTADAKVDKGSWAFDENDESGEMFVKAAQKDGTARQACTRVP